MLARLARFRELEDVVPASSWQDAVRRWIRTQLRAKAWKRSAKRWRARALGKETVA